MNSADADARIYVYDHDRANLENRRRITARELAGSELQSVPLIVSDSRNALLHAIAADAAHRRHSVALIDLRDDELDIDYQGCRVVEIIRRHPDLSLCCRPVVWTNYASDNIIAHCRTIGALGIVSDSWLLNTPGTPLTDVLLWAFDQRPRQWRFSSEFRSFHRSGSDPAADERRRDARFREWFGLKPDPSYYPLLWGLAHETDQTFLKRYLTQARVFVSERAAEGRLETLRGAIERNVAGRPIASEARRFLAQVMPPAANLEFPELDLPRAGRAAEAWEAAETRRDAYLPPSDIATLEFFFRGYAEPSGRLDGHALPRAVAERIQHVAAHLDQPQASVTASVYRGIRAIEDAQRDARLRATRDIA